LNKSLKHKSNQFNKKLIYNNVNDGEREREKICEIRYIITKTFKEYVKDQNQLSLVIGIKHSDK